MPPLSNARHEGFARAICRGESASKAYSHIYHVAGNNAEAAGSRLLRNVKVSERINELKEGAAKRTTKTVESLVSDLDAIIEFARKCGNPNAMVAAVNSQAKLLGLMVDRSEVTVAHKPAPLPTKVLELSEQEWTAQFGSGPGPRPALTENAKARKAEARKMNGGAHSGNAVAVAAPAIAWDAPAKEIDVPRRGVIELD
ncbi:terminase small subunit [Rhizobium ruizarguesonis]|uniref:Terminase small subunit n=1 Tax=Rhizobium ruizarguesonis TaxID=2081791 RepID=UPI0010386068|nr:Terminase small subunit [Rhizobium ruizarguesonis]TBB32607.1 Terminase small subunit [Rhizobium ruizarguesonis]